MENNEAIKQLLIIGNGFDLACGLKSQYTDFFNTIDPHIIIGIMFLSVLKIIIYSHHMNGLILNYRY